MTTMTVGTPLDYDIPNGDQNKYVLAVPAVSGPKDNWVAVMAFEFELGANHKLYVSSSGLWLFSGPFVNEVTLLVPGGFAAPAFSKNKCSFGVNSSFDRFYFGGRFYSHAPYNEVTLELGSVSGPTTRPHQDIKEILVPSWDNPMNNKVFVGTDGGFSLSSDHGQNFVTHNDGIACMQGYRVEAAEIGPRVMLSTQDNATALLREDLLVPNQIAWYQLRIGDGEDVLIERDNADNLYHGDYQDHDIEVSRNGGLTSAAVINHPGLQSKLMPLIQNPVPGSDDIYIGADPVEIYNYSILPIDQAHEFFSQSLPRIPAEPNLILDIAISKANPNLIYCVAQGYYHDGSGNFKLNSNDKPNSTHRLCVFKYDRAAASPNWVDISPWLDGLRVFGRPSSIAVSDKDPDKIWVTWEDYLNQDDQTQYLSHSTDGGTTWHFDATIPYTEATSSRKVVYRDGSADELFLALNGHIFWRQAGIWQELGTGFPMVEVNDLDIDYCEGKLLVGTYGRGAWSIDMPNLNGGSAEVITGDITWSTSRGVVQDIYIDAGASLTIDNNAIINFAKDTRLIVERGGRLDINNATLTNLCGETWGGIEIRGNSSLPHPLAGSVISGSYPVLGTDHGVLYMNNSEISKASIGIDVSGGELGPTFDGGVAVVLASTFQENNTSVRMEGYTDENFSEFVSCEFVSKKSGITTFLPSVDLYDVNGVDFDQCTFESGSFYTLNEPSEVGIRIFDGSLRALSCDFKNHLYGIEARAISHVLATPIRVSDSDFENNVRGVFISGIGNLEIYSNTFNVPDLALECYGLYLEGSTDYLVEDNLFTLFDDHTNGLPFCTGVYVANGHDLVTEIYRNQFERIESGIRAQGNNLGLQIRCNEFSLIRRYNIAWVSGTLNDQGYCALAGDPMEYQAPAGNVFSQNCNVVNGDFYAYPGSGGLTYHHHSEVERAPDCYSSSIILNDCGINAADGSSCPPTVGSPFVREANTAGINVDKGSALEKFIALRSGIEKEYSNKEPDLQLLSELKSFAKSRNIEGSWARSAIYRLTGERIEEIFDPIIPAYDQEESLVEVNPDFKVFPNPAKDLVRVQLPILPDGPVLISVLDLQGTQVMEAVNANSQNLDLDVSRLAAGVYYLQFDHEGQSYSSRFVISKD